MTALKKHVKLARQQEEDSQIAFVPHLFHICSKVFTLCYTFRCVHCPGTSESFACGKEQKEVERDAEMKESGTWFLISRWYMIYVADTARSCATAIVVSGDSWSQ